MATRTRLEFEDILKEQLHLLKKSCTDYDNGDEIEAIRIAGHLRTLLHNTNNSKALLELLNIRTIMNVFDSALPKGALGGLKIENINNMIITNVPSNYYAGLVCKEIKGNEKDLPSLKCTAQLEPAFLRKRISFSDWWENNIVFDDGGNNKLSRKDIVTLIANKDGYSHVDENPPSKYLIFKNSNIIQFSFNGQVVSPNNVPIYPSVRQIAFEYMLSLYDSYPEYKTSN
jgi:hypothetical protein